MRYVDGYIELNDEEISAWEIAFFRRIDRYQLANDFIAELMDLQDELEREMQSKLKLNDRTVRAELEAGFIETAMRMAKLYEASTREAMQVAGKEIKVH